MELPNAQRKIKLDYLTGNCTLQNQSCMLVSGKTLGSQFPQETKVEIHASLMLVPT